MSSSGPDLIVRSVSKADRRSMALDTTEEGTRMYTECADRIRWHEDRMLARLTARDRKALIAMLATLEATGA